MFNEISDGISIAINKAFGDRYEIYSEIVEQGLQEPCFLIVPVNASRKKLLGKRKQKTYVFDINYFPENQSQNDMLKIGDNLMEALDFIQLTNDDYLKGEQMIYEIIDEVLHFHVSFNVVTNDLTSGEKMESSTIDIKER